MANPSILFKAPDVLVQQVTALADGSALPVKAVLQAGGTAILLNADATELS